MKGLYKINDNVWVWLSKSIQKKPFKRRIDQAELLIDTKERHSLGNGHPAMLYRIKQDSGKYTFVCHLEN